MRKALLVVLPAAEVSEAAEPAVASTAERLLLSGAVELTKEAASPTVDPATVGTVTVPTTSVWFCVSVESAEVSSSRTVPKVPSEVRVGVTAAPLPVIPLVGTVPSRVVARAGGLEVDRMPDELVVSGITGFASVDRGKVNVSAVGKAAMASGGLRLASGVS